MRRETESAGYRHARLQEILLQETRTLLRDEVTDPTLSGVRIASVVLSPDYRHLRVHFTLLSEEPGPAITRKEVESALIRVSPFLRYHLATDLDLKRTPDLRFIFDGFALAEKESE